MHMPLVPIILISPLLLAVGYYDLRFMRIPNPLTLIAIGMFVVLALIAPPDDLFFRVVAALTVLVLGVIGFAFGLIGGGDVKFLSTLVLFVPVHRLGIFANVFSVSLLIGIALILGLRRIPATADWGWKSFSGSTKFPMGISIALAGLAFPWVEMALG